MTCFSGSSAISCSAPGSPEVLTRRALVLTAAVGLLSGRRAPAWGHTTGHLFVIWPRFPTLLRSRLIGYVWDAGLPIGTIVKSSKTSTVTFIVVRRGEDGLGQWLPERRNVVDDHRRVLGDAPDNPGALALSIDTNDTKSTAEARFARIAFAGA